ncbi:MAG TPA: hypothetical protein EYP24_03090, partial [bacterium (Candidatus Stahlbacteria)]|nr:hypothetical protein [Candidatus Stahlbacteria bacterium]
MVNGVPYWFSPHAQNEMVTPVIEVQIEEVGGVGVNQWIVNRRPDTLYIPSYPPVSISLFYTNTHSQGKFAGFGGLELILSRVGYTDPIIAPRIELEEWLGFARLEV